MNTPHLRVVFCGLLSAVVLIAAQGCVSSPHHRSHDGRPRHLRPHHRDGLKEVITTPVVIQKRSTPSAQRRRMARGMLLGTETLDLQIAWPTGLTGTATMPVQCYEAFIDEDSGTFYVGSDSTPLAVFGGTTSASVTFSNSNPPTSLRGSVDVNLDSQSGNFFFIGAGTSVSSGANTYLFRGGTILTKP